jgi:hypothetical protein
VWRRGQTCVCDLGFTGVYCEVVDLSFLGATPMPAMAADGASNRSSACPDACSGDVCRQSTAAVPSDSWDASLMRALWSGHGGAARTMAPSPDSLVHACAMPVCYRRPVTRYRRPVTRYRRPVTHCRCFVPWHCDGC